MNRSKLLSLVGVMVLMGCGSVGGVSPDAPPAADAPPPQWERIGGPFAGVRLDPGNQGLYATYHDGRIFFGPSVGNELDRYFRFFDPTTRTLSSALALPPVPSDFGAAGFGPVFVSNGQALYLLGDYGMKYLPDTNQWFPVTTYTVPTDLRRGEAAGAWVRMAQGSPILLIGGRDIGNNTLQSAIALRSDETFAGEPGMLPVGVSSAAAWSPEGGIVYVAGGDQAPTQMLAHTVGTSAWATLADLPASVSRPLGMGDFASRIWVASSSRIYFYDPSANAWDRQAPLPANTKRVVSAAGSVFALVDSANGAEFHRLVWI